MSENKAPREWWRGTVEILRYALETCLRAAPVVAVCTIVGGLLAALSFSVFQESGGDVLGMTKFWFVCYVATCFVLTVIAMGLYGVLSDFSNSERDTIQSLQTLVGEQRFTINQARAAALRVVLASINHVRESRVRQDGATNTHRVLSRRFAEDQVVELCKNDPALLGEQEVFDTLSHPDFHDMLRRHRNFFRTKEKGRALLDAMKQQTGN